MNGVEFAAILLQGIRFGFAEGDDFGHQGLCSGSLQ